MRLPSFAWVNLDWRWERLPLAFLLVELPLTVAALALFGIADPDLYRSKLWQEGANHGWNSDPIEILYAYANHSPIAVPAPWNQFITSFNVVISVLSMFIMLVKTVMYITHTFPPIVSAIVHGILIVLYSVSISQQAASDMSDQFHPSKVPWYLTQSCGPPVASNLSGYCVQAKGAFAVTVCLCALFFVYFVFSLINIPKPAASKAVRHSKMADAESPVSTFDDKIWELEMSQYPQTTGTQGGQEVPMTPRTLAFNTLDGAIGARKPNKDLPLRHHIAMGNETYRGRFAS